MYKNVASQKAVVYAYDKTTGLPQTGDAANITAYIAKDGVASAASNDTNPTEIDSANMPGYYAFDLTQAETNCDHFAMYAVSSTADILVTNVESYTQEVMRGTDSALLAASVNTAGGVVESNLVQVAGSATVDAVPIATWAARIFQALIRPFTGNFAARTKAFQDSAGATAFTHTYTNDGNNSRSLS